jgi:exosortase/archaeosortase
MSPPSWLRAQIVVTQHPRQFTNLLMGLLGLRAAFELKQNKTKQESTNMVPKILACTGLGTMGVVNSAIYMVAPPLSPPVPLLQQLWAMPKSLYSLVGEFTEAGLLDLREFY